MFSLVTGLILICYLSVIGGHGLFDGLFDV